MAELETIRIGAQAQASVPCAMCQTTTPPGQFYSYRGKDGRDVHLCFSCREKAESALKAETENPNYVGATLLGAGAGLVGGAIWYAITTLTNHEIGYVSIGIGWLVGTAVIYGAGRKRGPGLQFLSAGLALLTVFGAKYFTFLFYVKKYLVEHRGYSGPLRFISPLDPVVLKSMVSPIGLLIWGIALYVAFRTPQGRSL